jgi:4-hydroxy-tetrahydrodipicolinate synthase
MLVSSLVTPFRGDGAAPDLDLFARLTGFALDHGCDQVLVAGPSGEAGSLDLGEWESLLEEAVGAARPHQLMVCLGQGLRGEQEARGRLALQFGVRDLLVLDAPGSGAGSAALRERWHVPLARTLPDAQLWACAAPSLTGTELLPDDLARLREDCPNVVGVVDMTGRLARLARLRSLCGDDFSILCGDDAMLRDALVDPSIRADGGCITACNLAPGAVRRLHDEARGGSPARARELHEALAPLLGLSSFTVEETLLLHGDALAVPQRLRAPVAVKAALAELGILAPGCRPPLGSPGPNARARVRGALLACHRQNPELLGPLAQYFEVDVERRLASDEPRRAPPPAAAASFGG